MGIAVKDDSTRGQLLDVGAAMARDAARSAGSAIWRGLRADTRITAAGAVGLVVGLANEAASRAGAGWGVSVGLATVAGAATWFASCEFLATRAWLNSDEGRAVLWLHDLFAASEIQMPEIRQRANGHLDVSLCPASWRFQLDVVPSATIRSARAFCAQWPVLKTHGGEGCIAINLIEKAGRHVTMVVVWERERGTRIVPISARTAIAVYPHRFGVWSTHNPELGGWVTASYRNATEYRPSDGEQPILVDLDAYEGATNLPESPASPDAIAPAVTDDDLADHDEGEGEWDDEHGQPYDEPIPDRTCAPIRPAHAGDSRSDAHGGGGEETTPPVVAKTLTWAPPMGAPVPLDVEPERPLNAPSGSGAGNVWDMLQDGQPHPRGELARAVAMNPGSVGNLLTGWARLGLIEPSDAGWLVTYAHMATVAPDGDEEEG